MGPDTDLVIRVRVKPGARRTMVGGRYAGPRGNALAVAVTARAVDGRANAAVISALASALDIRSSMIQLVSGGRSRDKLVQVTAPDQREHRRLASRVNGLMADGELPASGGP